MLISSQVTAIVTSYMMSKFGIRKKIQEWSDKDLIIVFRIEFYEFWWKPSSQSDKMAQKLQVIKDIQISRHMTIYSQN